MQGAAFTGAKRTTDLNECSRPSRVIDNEDAACCCFYMTKRWMVSYDAKREPKHPFDGPDALTSAGWAKSIVGVDGFEWHLPWSTRLRAAEDNATQGDVLKAFFDTATKLNMGPLRVSAALVVQPLTIMSDWRKNAQTGKWEERDTISTVTEK